MLLLHSFSLQNFILPKCEETVMDIAQNIRSCLTAQGSRLHCLLCEIQQAVQTEGRAYPAPVVRRTRLQPGS